MGLMIFCIDNFFEADNIHRYPVRGMAASKPVLPADLYNPPQRKIFPGWYDFG
jgi:hypothetical protein